jgi:isopentenyl-diphosphate delta-isomerase
MIYMILNNDNEILDLVDNEDTVIGILERSQVYAANLHNFRVINAFLINEAGKLWVPRRTAQKRLFPLHLDVSVGGHVSSGETYEIALRREMQEEVGLDLDDLVYEDLGRLLPHTHGVSAFMHVYKFFYNDVPPYNKNDFMEYFWLAPNELKERIKNGDPSKSDLPLLLDFFF